MTTMLKTVTSGLAIFALSAGVTLADEKVATKDLPPAVVKAVQERFANCQILEAEKDDDGNDGKPEYEVKVRAADGKKYELEVTMDGKITDVDDD